MCRDNDNGLHSCFNDCPVCWSFTVVNTRNITNGGKVELGSFALFTEIAREGCQLCMVIVQMVAASGRSFQPSARVFMQDVEPEQKTVGPGKLDRVRFLFQNSGMVAQGLGHGYRVLDMFSYTNELGLYAAGGHVAEQIAPRKPADPSVSSPAHFRQATEWLNECLHNHDQCPSPLDSSGLYEPSFLPVRVIDCGLSAKGVQDKVKLHISNGQKATYVALSYCWGRTQQLTTVQSNIDTHVNDGILIEKLPKTIQDAICVTRNLKIPYLWIDSLCIIQDSVNDDWPRESAKMPDIYKNAFVTISAASATDCGQGFLQDREAVKMAARQCVFLPLLSETVQQLGVLFLCLDVELGHRNMGFDEEPINKRAWTLQESWLAPRVLIYGSGPLQYRCLTTRCTYGLASQPVSRSDSDEPRRRFFTSSNTQGNVPLSSQELANQRKQLLPKWESLLYDYSTRTLTKESDKFPAISGIAKEFHALLKDEYFAGLWSCTLPHSLLWYGKNGEDADIAKPPVSGSASTGMGGLVSSFRNLRTGQSPAGPATEPYIAPSWSPFQNKGPVLTNDVYDYVWPNRPRTLAEVKSFSSSIANYQAPFGAIRSARLEIEAPVARFSLDKLAANFVIWADGSPHIYWDYIIPDGGRSNYYLGPTAALQRENPNLNPQVSINHLLTSCLMVDEPRESDGDRPTPPVWARGAHQGMESGSSATSSLKPEDTPFFLLEITHTTVPKGLVLVNLHDDVYKRIGMFYMGRDLSARSQHEYAMPIAGRRPWDWDSTLSMRTCVLV